MVNINTDKNCKKQGKTPKNVRENVILKSRKKKLKNRGRVKICRRTLTFFDKIDKNEKEGVGQIKSEKIS